MAQDFHALFPLNDNDKVLNDADLHGVALAAIQGLNEKVESGKRKAETQIEELKTQNEKLQSQVADLQSQLESLQKTVARLAANSNGSMALNTQPQEAK
jgi:peptidoglycan hydrolase CwlO-like protein